MGQFATLSEVDRIASVNDPVQRNNQITQSYHELSLELSKRLGLCANWCTFATWASRQAGQTIRRNDLHATLESKLAAIPALSEAMSDIAELALQKGAAMDKHRIGKLVWVIIDPKAAMNRASDAVARGNQKVYAEIAREFARFLDVCGKDDTFNAENITRFCDTLKPGDPPNGQQYLKQAFQRYYEAFFEPDKKKKAELMLLANIEVGFHEQTRLQPEIKEALEASVLDARQFKEHLISALFPHQGWINYLGDWFRSLFNQPSPLDKTLGAYTDIVRRQIRLFLTANMMELGFPQGVRLRLGKDLKANFPPDLQQLAHADLIAILKKIDPTPNSLTETAAVDWANLYDRLHFIADLFRCYHDTQELVSAPPFDSSVAPTTE